MITKNDCIVLLTELNESGVDTTEILRTLVKAQTIPTSVIKFINDNRQLDLTAFYEKLRVSYNHKHSKLYGNIVKEKEDTTVVLSTLSALLTQILLYAKNAANETLFLKHSRAEEITKVLTLYFKNYDITTPMKLLQVIKADIKVLESMRPQSSNTLAN